MKINARLSKWLPMLGYGAYFGLACVVLLIFAFPYHKVKDLLEDQVASSGEAELTIGEVSANPLLGVTLHDVALRLLPKRRSIALPGAPQSDHQPQPKSKPMRFERVSVGLSLWGLLFGDQDVSLSFEGLGGEAEASLERSGKRWSIEAEAEGIRLAAIPPVRNAIGLPVKGVCKLNAKMEAEEGRVASSSGEIKLDCQGGAIGDGQAKLKIPGNAFLAMGLTLPRVSLGRVEGNLRIEKGIVTFRRVATRSKDVELMLEGSARLGQPLRYSTMSAYLRFRLSQALISRDSKFELLQNGLSAGKRADGFYGFRLSGQLSTLRPVPSRVAPPPAPGLRAPG